MDQPSYSGLLSLVILCTIYLPVNQASAPAGHTMDPLLQEEFCKNFTYGNGRDAFFSPGFPRNYPPGMFAS